MTARKTRKRTAMVVWVGVDSEGDIHLDTIAGHKEACDNSHSICEGDILLHTTRATLTLSTPKRRGKKT